LSRRCLSRWIEDWWLDFKLIFSRISDWSLYDELFIQDFVFSFVEFLIDRYQEDVWKHVERQSKDIYSFISTIWSLLLINSFIQNRKNMMKSILNDCWDSKRRFSLLKIIQAVKKTTQTFFSFSFILFFSMRRNSNSHYHAFEYICSQYR
jgi:hypothetical protein